MSEHQSSSAPTNGWACPTCGYMCWPGLTHSCPTGISVQMPLLTGSVLLDAQLAERDRELASLRAELSTEIRDLEAELAQSQHRERLSRAELAAQIKRNQEFWKDYADQTCRNLEDSNAKLQASMFAQAQRIKELESQLALYPFDAATMNLQIHNLSKEQNEWRTRALHFQNLLADSRRENARLREALQNLLNSHHAVWDSPPPDPKFIRQWADNPVVQRAQSALKLSPAPAKEAK